jgi:hypothetical protein
MHSGIRQHEQISQSSQTFPRVSAATQATFMFDFETMKGAKRCGSRVLLATQLRCDLQAVVEKIPGGNRIVGLPTAFGWAIV